MAETKIEWADFTFNPWVGCSKVSLACAHCYAEGWAKRSGLVEWGNSAKRRRTSEANWRKPLTWNKEAKKAGERWSVFCASLADVFEDREELEPWREELFELIEQTPNLNWLLLTKRPENLERMLPWTAAHAGEYRERYWPHVWIGVTVENQEMADKRIPALLNVPAAVRFLSVEPLLGPIQIGVSFIGGSFALYDYGVPGSRFHWVIVGGESGPNSRPMQREWVDSLVEQCGAAGVPVFVKQLGAAFSDPENGIAGRSLKVPADAGLLISRRLADPKGGNMDEWPAGLGIRQFPVTA